MLLLAPLVIACHLLFPYAPAGGSVRDGVAADATAARDADDAKDAATTPDWASPAVPRSWSLVPTTTSPGGIWLPVLAYAPTLRGVVLYGGNRDTWLNPAGASAEMWLYRDGGWTLLCADCAPGPRSMHGLVYDEARGTLVLFGGHSDLAVADNPAGLWEWSAERGWEPVAPTGVPPAPRIAHAMVYDRARACVVLFGGQVGDTASDELFEYDGARWVPHPQQGSWPAARGAAGATYDAQRAATLIYGGASRPTDARSGRTDDLWAWDGAQWRQLCAACTGSARVFAALQHDPAAQQTLLMGGFEPPEMAGTWVLGAQGFVVVDVAAPAARDSAGVTFDADRGVIVLYGGNGSGCERCSTCAALNCDETLEYGPAR